MENDYHEKIKRLYDHCERIVERSKGKRLTTIRKAAKALRMQQPEVMEMAEDLSEQGLLVLIKVKTISRMTKKRKARILDLSSADWQLEPVKMGAII